MAEVARLHNQARFISEKIEVKIAIDHLPYDIILQRIVAVIVSKIRREIVIVGR